MVHSKRSKGCKSPSIPVILRIRECFLIVYFLRTGLIVITIV